MNHLYTKLNKVLSHLITWGIDPIYRKENEVILCVTGNPGISDFYTEFGAELNKKTKLPVVVVGHAGHEEVPDVKPNILKGQEQLFDLQGQVDHKLDLINNRIHKDCKLHLIGHSIGAWIILDILQNNKELIERVSSVSLMFPTVQKMAKSKNGLFINNVLRNIHPIIMLLFKLADFIPLSIKNVLIGLYLKIQSLPPDYLYRILKFFNPYVGEKVLFMAYDEMDRVQSLHSEVLETIKGSTCVLYSPRDGWAPVEYMEDLRQFEPELKLKKVDVDHAFVMKSSTEIAEIVSDFIRSKAKQYTDHYYPIFPRHTVPPIYLTE